MKPETLIVDETLTLLLGQNRVLEMIASGSALGETLTELLHLLEGRSPEMLCSVLLLDRDGLHLRHGAAPSLPDEYMKAIDGAAIGARAGSCGTAAFRGEPVVVEEIDSDPLWADYKHLALPHGLHACWSTPIFDARQRVLGTFAIYYRRPGRPDARHLRLIAIATRVAAIAISHDRLGAGLRESEARYRHMIETTHDLVHSLGPDGKFLFVNGAWSAALGWTRDEALRLHYRDLIKPDRLTLFEALFDGLRQGRNIPAVELAFIAKNGRELVVEGSLNGIHRDGQFTGTLSFFRDITDRRRAEDERRQVFERVTDAFVALDKSWRYSYVNAKAGQMFGRPPEALIGKHIWTEFPEGVGQKFHLAYERAMAEQRPAVLEEYYPPYDRWFENRIYPSSEGLTIYFHDITERVKAEATRREHEARTQLLLSASDIGLWEWNLVTDRVVYSREYKLLLGYREDELPDRFAEWENRLHPGDRERMLGSVRDFREGRRAEYEEEFRMRHRDGSWRWVIARAKFIRDDAGKPERMMGCLIDITQRKQAEATLHLAHDRLETLSRRLLEIQETERRMLARELHDEIGQALTAAKINLQTLQRFPDPADLAPRLEDSVALVARALEQVRSRSLELRPPMLDDLGLIPALRWLADLLARRAGLRISFASDPPEARFAPGVETACFRVAQEALTNVIKHAGARSVAVALQARDGALTLTVRDDGAGFAPGAAARGDSLGLSSMKERAVLLGGGIEWLAPPGGGTEVHAWFPLPAAAPPGQEPAELA